MKKGSRLDEIFAEQTTILLTAIDRVHGCLDEMNKQSEARTLFYLDLIEKHKKMKQQ